MCTLELLLKSPVIAAIIGALAVCFGLRRFIKEQWWQRKATAYAAAIEALHILEDNADQRIDAIEKSVELPMPHIEKMRIASVQARAEIRKVASLGGFVVKEDAAKILNDLTRSLELQHEGVSPADFWNARGTLVSEALTAVKLAAKKDLHPWMSRFV